MDLCLDFVLFNIAILCEVNLGLSRFAHACGYTWMGVRVYVVYTRVSVWGGRVGGWYYLRAVCSCR